MIFVDAYLVDWLDLLIRWLHVVAAIVWIGTSFYFVALDSHLLPPRRSRDSDEGVAGESWEIHGGGFYRIHKFRVTPESIPEPLHWYKWEAYTTWLSGFALLVVLYYLDADSYLVDPSVRDLDTGAAIGISIALLAIAWLVYDGLCRLLGNRELLLAAALVAFVAASAYTASELFSARALPIQVGAMLGTMMVGNVLVVIIPGHWELVHAKRAGREPDPVHGIKGKQRSVHNNYLTLPVVLAMLGPHFPFAFAGEHGWLVLVALMLVGAWIRLYFNLRHRGRTIWWIPATRRARGARDRDRDPSRRRRARGHRGGAVRAGRGDRRAALCRLPLDVADEPVVLVRAGGDHVRHAGADPRPRRRDRGAGGAHTCDAARERHRDDRRRARAPRPLDRAGR